MSDESEAEQEIVMPFVNVVSKGGQLDDFAFACGWEAGVLDVSLAFSAQDKVRITIHKVNTQQADLIAMRHGWIMAILNETDNWTQVLFTRSENYQNNFLDDDGETIMRGKE